MSQVLCYFLLKVLHVQWKKLSRRLRCKNFLTFNVIIKQFRIKSWILHTIFYKNNDMKARSIMGTEDGLPPPSPHFFSQQTYFLNLHKKNWITIELPSATFGSDEKSTGKLKLKKYYTILPPLSTDSDFFQVCFEIIFRFLFK